MSTECKKCLFGSLRCLFGNFAQSFKSRKCIISISIFKLSREYVIVID